MSIYGTWLMIEHPDQWVRDLAAQGINAGVIGDDTDERELGSPIVYQGSHILPSDEDRRGGSVEVGGIPGFITRDGRDNDATGRWDWLRLGVVSEDSDEMWKGKPYVPAGHAVVVLDRPQVERLRDTLTRWLDREEEPDE